MAARSEKWCTSSAKCKGFDYFNISSNGQKCGKSSFLGWLGCADFKDSVSEVTANHLNTLFVKPPYKPGKPGQAPPPAPPAPAPARQCYTRNPTTKAIYVMTNGWPDELVFPDGILHASPAPTVSLLGLAPGAAPQSYKTTTRGARHAFAASAALHRDRDTRLRRQRDGDLGADCRAQQAARGLGGRQLLRVQAERRARRGRVTGGRGRGWAVCAVQILQPS